MKPRFGSSDLVGTWLMVQEGSAYPLACDSSEPVQYNADGTFSLFDERGIWRLDGKALTETSTGFDPLHHDASEVSIGRPYVSTLRWNNRNRFWKRFADGESREFLRCPKRK